MHILSIREASKRLLASYGTWTMMASMFLPIDFLRLQALNKYAYSVVISRVQTRWALLRLKPLTVLNSCQAKTSCSVILDPHAYGYWKKLTEDNLLSLSQPVGSIIVGPTLIVFNKIRTGLRVRKFVQKLYG